MRRKFVNGAGCVGSRLILGRHTSAHQVQPRSSSPQTFVQNSRGPHLTWAVACPGERRRVGGRRTVTRPGAAERAGVGAHPQRAARVRPWSVAAVQGGAAAASPPACEIPSPLHCPLLTRPPPTASCASSPAASAAHCHPCARSSSFLAPPVPPPLFSSPPLSREPSPARATRFYHLLLDCCNTNQVH